MRLIKVVISWEEALCNRKAEENVWLEAVVVKNIEISEESGSCLYYSDLEVGI